MQADVWFDGACSGNPGPMGGGALVIVAGKRQEIVAPLGHGTNNEAEYGGLIAGLRAALEAGAHHVCVYGDSQLVLRQLAGEYTVRAANLRPLYQEARRLLGRFKGHELQWVPRDQNAEADALARQAI